MVKGHMNKIQVVLIFLLLSLISCQELLFSDEEEIREISLGEFRNVSVRGIYNIVLIQDSTDRIIISGCNKTEKTEAETQNDTLYITDRNRINVKPGRNTLYLHFTGIEYLETCDPANVTSADTIRTDRFSWDAIGEIAEGNIDIKCSDLLMCTSANTLGTFKFRGEAENCSFFIRYGSILDAGSLKSRSAGITNDSAGDVIVNASEYLTANIWGSGNILYYGDPVTELTEQKGSGRLIKLKAE